MSKISPRHRARECALQALYSWLMSHNDVADVEVAFMLEQEMKGVDVAYFRTLLQETVKHEEALKALIEPHLDRAFKSLDPIERVLLLMAAYELRYQDVPYKVVINEAVEVAKTFGAEEGHKYINGVLDKIAQGLAK
ncbi:transcription antitermination factor NusB [Pasteurellaceae bacterium HPA106]|uniref:transcription antitermination factor NusB n=1 Tax=Spirabiliibacterium pneumoniae TaxID=221400 RepID=UPI001AAC8DAE|nr:transcription antitermination factor NusB [Spirabiliibacterium pneumoniae]MBE2896520.1 transcription antitermination factor NusB [Spirabiliibacterium pneumoniae]